MVELTLEQQIIKNQSSIIGELTTTNIELSTRLMQAVGTAEALAKELEGMKRGNSEQQELQLETD